MKLYEMTGAPNPRRVRVFLAEKGITVPSVQVDMRKGEHKSPEFLKKNPSGKIPVLELDDGTCIAESVAICRYFEALQPTAVVVRRDAEGTRPHRDGEPATRIRTAGADRRRMGQRTHRGADGAGPFQTESTGERNRRSGNAAFYKRLDEELAHHEYMADDAYSIADITALCVIDFAASLVDLKPDASLKNLWRWHAAVSSRPSAKA